MEHCDLPINGYLKKAWDACVPVFATLELTLKCNLRCVHCYNFDRAIPYAKAKRENELTLPEIKDLIDELAEAGTISLGLSGGEPLIHPDIFEIISYAREKRLSVRLKTNAIFLTEEKAKKLADLHLSGIDVSVYGACAETHDAFTKQKGSFEKTWSGIRMAKKYKLVPSISYVLHRGCVDEFAEMVAKAQNEDVHFNPSLELTARYDGSESSLDHRLTREDLLKLYTGEKTKDQFEGIYHPNATDANVQCPCARTVCGIASNGDVYPCIGAPVFAGNLRMQGFGEIWKNSEEFKKIRGLTLPDFKDCVKCGDKPYCGRSSGVVYSNTGNYTGSDEWSCMNAKLIHELNDNR